MAYASKYYDPVKAHEYYMRNRELKGYEDRYGGSRGDGTSAASGGFVSSNSSTSNSSSSSSGTNSKELTPTQKHNQSIKNEIQSLRDKLNSMSKEDRKANREAIQDQIQKLREQTKGGSTSGFNQKGIEAATYIKDQMELERDGVIKKANEDCDKEMLDSVQRLADRIKEMRESGSNFSNKEFLARVKAMLSETKKKKIKAKRKYIAEYKQKYKDEIDKLRSDTSIYSYYDKKAAKRSYTNGSYTNDEMVEDKPVSKGSYTNDEMVADKKTRKRSYTNDEMVKAKKIGSKRSKIGSSVGGFSVKRFS